MQVKNVMSGQVEIISPDSSLQEAARRMRALDIGVMPVGKGGEIRGIVTDRDITVRAVSRGLDPKTASVQEVMTTDLVSCYEDQTLGEAAEVMESRQVRRLLVLNQDNQLVGIVSIGDIAVGGGDRQLAGEMIQQVSRHAA